MVQAEKHFLNERHSLFFIVNHLKSLPTFYTGYSPNSKNFPDYNRFLIALDGKNDRYTVEEGLYIINCISKNRKIDIENHIKLRFPISKIYNYFSQLNPIYLLDIIGNNPFPSFKVFLDGLENSKNRQKIFTFSEGVLILKSAVNKQKISFEVNAQDVLEPKYGLSFVYKYLSKLNQIEIYEIIGDEKFPSFKSFSNTLITKNIKDFTLDEGKLILKACVNGKKVSLGISSNNKEVSLTKPKVLNESKIVKKAFRQNKIMKTKDENGRLGRKGKITIKDPKKKCPKVFSSVWTVKK